MTNNLNRGVPFASDEHGASKYCRQCGQKLTADEIALNRKMISRSAETFFCKTCFAAYFGVTVQKVDEKIRQFKRQGCLLFVPDEALPHEGSSS